MRSPLRRLTGVQIVGTGSYVPDNVVTNEDLASLGCDADWIIQRTGIRERRHAPPEISTSDMAVAAAERCIEAAGVDRSDIDLLVLGTLSPDYLLPATAAAVQDRLGLNCAAMDVSAACAGFMYALVTGMQFVATGSQQVRAGDRRRHEQPRDEPGRQENVSAVRRRRRRRARHQGQRRTRAACRTRSAPTAAGEQLLMRPGRRLARAARRRRTRPAPIGS